jgi:hypothetical protein
MSKRFFSLVGLVAAALALAQVAVASMHEGENFLSQVNSIRPAISGLTVKVVERDGALRLVNKTGKTVRVAGYEGEPYLRVYANGLVQVNDRSPTRYLNEDRYAQTGVPKNATAKATPVWRTLSRNGTVEWDDHRIHLMSEKKPPSVKDAEMKTKLFDWKVPIGVGSANVTVAGSLFWDPMGEDAGGGGGGSSTIPIIAGVAAGVVVLLVIAFFATRRRRGGGGEPRPKAPKAESW